MSGYLRAWLCVLVALLGILPAKAYDFRVDGIYYAFNGGGLTVVSGDTDYSGDVVIPSTVSYDGKVYSVTSIDSEAFSWCTEITSVSIPHSVTSVGKGPFFYCSNLEEIMVSADNPVYSSLDGVLYNKDKTELLKCPDKKMSVTIPNSVTTIGDTAFSDCIGLTSLTIPNSVTSVGIYAFYDCNNLTSVTIPESVTKIMDGTFSSCRSLTSVVIPNSITSIGDLAFSACGLTSVTIPESVMSIGNLAFYFCNDLTSVVIGNSVTSIGEKAFVGCPWLEEIIVSADNPAYTSLDGVLYNKDKTELLKWPSRKLNVTIPNSVEVIGNYAFSSCQDLTSVEIPNSVMSIGDGAFSSCRGLTSVEIPNSVTSIGDVAFSWCTQLTLVTIGESLTSIGDGAFSEYTNLQKMVVHAINPPQISSNTFSDYDMPLYVPAGSKKDYQEALYWENFTHIRETADPLYTIAVNSGDESKGRVTGGGRYREGTAVFLSAEPVGEYEFVQWSDGHTENPRRITVTEDLSLTAEFSLPSSKLSVNANDDAKGRVVALLTAAPQDNNRFVQWNDGDVKNPRTVYVTGPTNIVAEFNDSDKSVGAATGGVPHLRIEGRTLHVESGGVDYRVYTATGRQVYVGNRSTLLLSEGGTYQVHIGDYKQEIVVK